MAKQKKPRKKARRQGVRLVPLREHKYADVGAEINVEGRYTYAPLKKKAKTDGAETSPMLFEISGGGITIKVADIPRVLVELVRLAAESAKTDAEIDLANDLGIDPF